MSANCLRKRVINFKEAGSLFGKQAERGSNCCDSSGGCRGRILAILKETSSIVCKQQCMSNLWIVGYVHRCGRQMYVFLIMTLKAPLPVHVWTIVSYAKQNSIASQIFKWNARSFFDLLHRFEIGSLIIISTWIVWKYHPHLQFISINLDFVNLQRICRINNFIFMLLFEGENIWKCDMF